MGVRSPRLLRYRAPSMRTVWFIRHAQSEANAGLPTSDPANIAITERGRTQAECVARFFSAPPARIVTSAFLRTRQTAAPTIARFPEVPRDEWPIHEFTYLAPGPLRGTTAAQRRPLVDAFWTRCDPHHCDGEGAESFAALLGRVGDAVARLEQSSEPTLAVFTHGQFLRALLWSLLIDANPCDAESMVRFRRFAAEVSIPNAAILPLCHKPGEGWSAQPMITWHLPGELITY